MDIIQRFDAIEKDLSSIDLSPITDDQSFNLVNQLKYSLLDIIDTNKKILSGEMYDS